MGLFFDGLGKTTLDIPIEEHLSGEIAVLLTFNEITDVNETFESVNLTDGFTNFELDVDPDNPDNPLVRNHFAKGCYRARLRKPHHAKADCKFVGQGAR